MTASILIQDLGQIAYGPALDLQRSTQQALVENHSEARETVFMLEHSPPVITFGRNTKREHLLVDEHKLRALGADVFETGRGGDVTYHGPGQLVVYPILQLVDKEQDIKKYVAALEQLMMRMCKDFGIDAHPVEGLRGLWVGNDKIGAIGVRMSRWVSMHGFALNINTDLTHFEWIVPCGLHGRGVTSMQRLLGREVAMAEVKDVLIKHAPSCLNRDLAGVVGLESRVI